MNPGAVVPSVVLSYQVHLVFPDNPYTAVRVDGVLATVVWKVEHHVLPSVGAVLVASNSAWKNEAITTSEFHLKSVIDMADPPDSTVIEDVPAYITTLFVIALLVDESIPTPPLHLAAVVASAQTTKPAESATLDVVNSGKLIPSLAWVN